MKVCVLSLLLVSLGCYGVDSYSQVSTSGSGTENGPKVYKSLNMDLIFPRTFNSSENVISTTQKSAPELVTVAVESLSSTAGEQFTPEYSSSQISADPPPAEPPIPANHSPPAFVIPDNHAVESEEYGATLPPPATGRAVDYRPAYPFSQLLTPNSKGYRPSVEQYPLRSRPLVSSPSSAHRVVYPSYQASRTPSRAEIDKLSGKGKFSDRFTPSEGVASSIFKQTQKNNHNHKPSISRPIGQPSKKVTSFVPTKDLYSFPPNINARYPSPLDTKQASPSDTVTSYLPPAAGPLDAGKLVGPVNPDLLPSSMKNAEIAKDASGGGYSYDPPQPALDTTDLGGNNDGGDDQDAPPDDNIGVMPAPADDDDDAANDSPPPPPPPPSADYDHHDHHDHHDHDYPVGGYTDDKEYPTPPPGYLEEHDHHDHDPDHHHHHRHPDIDFSQGPYLDDSHHHHDHFLDHHYPDVIYDDYHFHHDHPIVHHPEPTTEPPPPPPPPAPEQPRVKKYSYFYIGRKLWYIPLYFTLWFTFYVLWLILKSIARHKVNLPNHYVTRRSIEDLSHREAREAIDKLTVRVMDGIEKFQQRFIG